MPRMKRTIAKMLQRAEQHHGGEAVVGEAAAAALAEKVADGRRLRRLQPVARLRREAAGGSAQGRRHRLRRPGVSFGQSYG